MSGHLSIHRIVTPVEVVDALHRLYRDTTNEGCEYPLDVRLVVDLDGDGGTWDLKYGDVQYDSEHSDICAAGTLDHDTIVNDLANDLLSEADDQLAELRGEAL